MRGRGKRQGGGGLGRRGRRERQKGGCFLREIGVMWQIRVFNPETVQKWVVFHILAL